MREAEVGLRSTGTIKFYFKKALQCERSSGKHLH